MITRINGLLSCQECGASVTEDMTDLHLQWHKEINDAFSGAVLLIKDLSERLGERHTE